jgi:hypothetical protein
MLDVPLRTQGTKVRGLAVISALIAAVRHTQTDTDIDGQT